MGYTDDKNIFYHQKKNLATIDSLNLKSKIYPHRVNTLGKLSETLYSGCSSIEVDVIFKQQEGFSYFEIGHDSGALSGIQLEDFLIEIGDRAMKNIWLDIFLKGKFFWPKKKKMNEKNFGRMIFRQEVISGEKIFGR